VPAFQPPHNFAGVVVPSCAPQDQMTILDPGALEHPWVMTLIHHHVANMPHILDRDCAESDRNPIVDGKISIAPPKP
jgi:hypothetical protein